MLDDILIERRYRNGPESIAKSFLIPALATAVSYDRAAGYFTSSSLALAARGLTGLIRNGGSMRLIASPILDSADVQAIADGYDQRDIVDRRVATELRNADLDQISRDRLGFLAWMIRHKFLDIRLALVESIDGIGIYHEKFGVIRDDSGNEVGFSGSANESVGGLQTNYESIDVFRSWMPFEDERIEDLQGDFDHHWNNETTRLRVFEFPEAARRELLRLSPSTQPRWDPAEITGGQQCFAIPSTIRLRGYQKDAIHTWFQHDGRGIYAMATGTGKTITAIATAVKVWEQLSSKGSPLLILVVVPFKHLVDQWENEFARFGATVLKCFESQALWTDQLADEVASLNSPSTLSVAVATSATFSGDALQHQLSFLHSPMLLIADEVHNLGAPHLRTALPQSAQFRLGLSATPERHRDDVGTSAIFEYFGEVVADFPLDRAIQEGFLTPYEYRPILVEFDDTEVDQYRALTNQIHRLMAMGVDDPDADGMTDGPLKHLLIRRARLVGSASAKLPALQIHLSSEPKHTLVYCSDSRLDPLSSPPGEKQIDAVVRMIGNDLGVSVNRYTAETPVRVRRDLRHEFAAGDVQVLAAIRCLDEGVDIPETRIAHILASSTNPRQFIQRRGRILRKSPGKDMAVLYDYIVVPPEGALIGGDFETDRRLVRREMQRVVEFANSATNVDLALHDLLDLRVRYDLLDME